MALKYLLAALVGAAAVSPAGTLASAIYRGSSSVPDAQLSLQIQVLQEVVAGILSGRTVVLYLDRAITPQTLGHIITLFTLRDCPLVLVDLGSDGEEWSHKQSLGVLRAEYMIHAKNKPEGEGDGVQVEVLDALATKLNYTFNLTTEPPDEKWGSFENGSWNGMLGMIHRGEKNFTVNYFGYTNKRIEDFDATVSYWMEGFGLALLKPQPLPKWRSVYYPFTPLVWASAALAFSVVTIAFYLQDIAETKPTTKNSGLVWLYVLRPMLSHALPRLPVTHSQRVFVASWWLTSLILTTAYTANLIAFLTIPLYPKKLQTVEELAESNYRLASRWDSSVNALASPVLATLRAFHRSPEESGNRFRNRFPRIRQSLDSEP
ncbi:hypothetical protein O3P69_020760 [Scylla paramamosain]|uniref:Ionotropic glutamate receptor L-glutamate and glycine-binding domain-containing protein n=1 Tax=Scylla paramamosain TaxID=85552 RepID=A0AAW0TNB5_SCYPA